jgi:hypothetical protein
MTVRERIDHSVTLLSGMALGAGLMYVFDPRRGAQRRAQARDKLIRGTRFLGCYLDKRSRDLANRSFGAIAELGSSIRDRVRSIDDEVLVERVRAQLGHVVSHPALIHVDASDGRIRITGHILDGELDKIRTRVARIRGVKECDLRVDAHSQPELERVSGLQGAPRRSAIIR